MAFVINGSSLFVKRYLKVMDWGVEFMETAALGGKRKFNFGEIDYALLSASHVLSFQVGQEVFKIQTNPAKPKHQLAINHLMASLGSSIQRVGGFPVLPAR